MRKWIQWRFFYWRINWSKYICKGEKLAGIYINIIWKLFRLGYCFSTCMPYVLVEFSNFINIVFPFSYHKIVRSLKQNIHGEIIIRSWFDRMLNSTQYCLDNLMARWPFDLPCVNRFIDITFSCEEKVEENFIR